MVVDQRFDSVGVHCHALSVANINMSNLEYIHKQLCYAEEQLDLADDLSSKETWSKRVDVLEAAWQDEASKHVSKSARESVPQVLTINYQ
jgi:hypothetical protein|tara:strand:+ start:214 stop:483 length:270 start_codon:yes stop_codon:yes gene_type:complete